MGTIPNRASILVVEDESIIAKDLKNRLNQMGYAVSQIAATGEEAVSMAASSAPDLVLMDIGLKGSIDGIEAARRIQQQFKIPVVFLSAYPRENALARGLLNGPVEYVGKPFYDDELHAILNKHFSKAKKRRK